MFSNLTVNEDKFNKDGKDKNKNVESKTGIDGILVLLNVPLDAADILILVSSQAINRELFCSIRFMTYLYICGLYKNTSVKM